MNPEPKDDLDRHIDEALTAFAAQEPRRVNAASVRRAMGARPAPTLPAWFAVAAILIVALALALLVRTPPEKAPEVIAGSVAAPVTREPLATPSMEIEPAVQIVAETNERRSRGRQRARGDTPAEPPYEGLPRLVVDAIVVPELRSTGPLAGESIVIPQIEIAPLAFPSLSEDHEPKP